MTVSTQEIFLHRLQRRIESICASGDVEQSYIVTVDYAVDYGVGTVRVFHAKTLTPSGSIGFSFDSSITLRSGTDADRFNKEAKHFKYSELAAAIDYAFSCFEL